MDSKTGLKTKFFKFTVEPLKGTPIQTTPPTPVQNQTTQTDKTTETTPVKNDSKDTLDLYTKKNSGI